MTAPYGPGAPPAWGPSRVWAPHGAPPSVDVRQADLAALSRIKLAALIAVVGAALGVALPLALSSLGYFTFTVPTAGGTFSYSQTSLALPIGTVLVGLALTLVSLWFYRDGFQTIRAVDDRFRSAPTYVLLAIIGIVVVLLGLVLLLVELFQILSCAVSGAPIPTSCISLGGVLGGLALALIGVILLLIGYIGMLVAIWRLGTRYGDSLFKIGAVLLIFPYLSVVGQILILVAASRAESQVRQHAAVPTYAPSVTTPPPPPPY